VCGHSQEVIHPDAFFPTDTGTGGQAHTLHGMAVKHVLLSVEDEEFFFCHLLSSRDLDILPDCRATELGSGVSARDTDVQGVDLVTIQCGLT
jgi:hypothetical protein